MQGRTKVQAVHVIVLSDILLFLVESNNKFLFFTPDGKVSWVVHFDEADCRANCTFKYCCLFIAWSCLPAKATDSC